jgi:hypothetical protein
MDQQIHAFSNGWKAGYQQGYQQGLAAQPQSWKTGA